MNKLSIAYITFDIVPAPKGASIHIEAFSSALADVYKEIHLLTVSPTVGLIESDQIHLNIKQVMLPAVGNDFIQRVLYFRRELQGWLNNRRFDVIHIRSIYEGLIIACNKKQYCDQMIFEVNGLPSIELKYRYPAVANDDDLLYKLYSQEQICLDAADLIVTPSNVTAKYLQGRGISENKIKVIPNGVDLDIFICKNTRQLNINVGHLPYQMLYFGTLSPWQGVNLAVEALGLLNRDFPACLTVIGQGRNHQIKTLKQLAYKLGVADKLNILEPMSQKDLVAHIHSSDVILAPLAANDRNLVQGCCPLKILEGMATGTPVITSDIPVVQELGENGVHFLSVKPGSAKAIKDAVLQLRNDGELGSQLAANARQRIEEYYTWQGAGKELIAAYQELLTID
ncbi:Glycosyl transferase, group 1 [Trichormus variabilis ATCC 29413]|uniref:Glycosyl transferase, group 1 n=2 Tax=Anabaena variabilis TaxID=264691 RepID=Q3MCY7_TRIV2|nr:MULTISPECIES: glycosyltransferase family 4 protein [Nostocaceae]ABA21149.1 Glycosyl transferase, group 1 [Trichormus variabilis ATCC 29413]MBC1213764.1 glycosyltransferase family 4 protein [Trichormus variabilis ARAD]MBC1255641.1 glycosyltransferase family 4 protein [Trichormus variabilis V5]MBC1266937.1 glycosyltransferase family 4 protein [Trichormus variabilis FSR]MBC1301513.1 glycosyltransferase family 4 protein [Trichormus variabilis N2B]